MNNGASKGGTPSTFQILRTSPGLLDVGPLHYSEDVDKQTNPPEQFISNLDSTPGHEGHYIKLSARPDGSFTVSNERNGFTNDYPAKP